MSNKSKSHQQDQPIQPQQQQQQQQQPQQQQLTNHHHPLNKQTVGIPPQYQAPPQPTIGILKNSASIPSVSSTTILNGYTQSQQQSLRVPNLKDVQGKLGPKIDTLIQQPLMVAGVVPKVPSHLYYPSKISPGQFLPGNNYHASATQNIPKQRISDEEFMRLTPIEMLKFVRKTESDIARIVAEQNRQIQSLLSELRALKEANQRLNEDNQELRDLCCFLDDDRQKGRKLAREWQRFGRYTASVMRQEVSAYQNKLRQLDNKQQELIKDNLELKELCLYLDEERGGVQRDDGDGSSSSTNAEETLAPRARPNSIFNDQTMQYVRSLEQRVKQLEEDKCTLQARARSWEAELPDPQTWDHIGNSNGNSHNNFGGRPEAVVQALQVLEVREQLEREAAHDGEKALVREMCNVVWRKLEEGPHIRR